MSVKSDFAFWACEQVGRPVLWAAKGDHYVDAGGAVISLPGVTVYDCSGLVTCGIKAMGGPDHRDVYNAQKLYDACAPVSLLDPEPGDLGFYGRDEQHVDHVVIALAGGHLVSADGATSRIRSLIGAKEAGAQVRFHQAVDYRRDEPFLGFRRNPFLT